VSESYTTIEREAALFAIQDAERDVLALSLRSSVALDMVCALGVTAEMMSDLRHHALLAMLVDLRRIDVSWDNNLESIAIRVAELRAGRSTNPVLSAAGDLDGEFLMALWTYNVPERHTLSSICSFLLSASREGDRDRVVEACIAALARGSDQAQVLAHLRAALDPSSTPGPDVPSAVLSIPPTKEQ